MSDKTFGPRWARRALRALVLVSGMTLLGAGAAAAAPNQPEPTVLKPIVVTSQRREESLKDVPISITAFTAAALRDNMVDDLTGYFDKTPNVSYMEGGARSKRSISIRGVSDIGGLTSSFAVYVDEFNVANGPVTANDNNTNGSLNPQLHDIERIEVLRGPQGTFFGRNAAGGALSFITKKPTADFYAEGSAGFGRFGSWELGAVVNGAAVKDKLYLRASAFRSESDGFVKNADPAGGRSDTEYDNFRVAARLLATEQTTVDVTATYTGEQQGLDSSVSSGVLDPSSAGLIAALGLTEPILDGLATYPSNTTRVSHNTPLRQDNEFFLATGRVEYVADSFTLTSVTGYFDTSSKLTSDIDLTSFDYINQTAAIDTRSIGQEIRVRSNDEGSVDWLVGALYGEDELTQDFLVSAGADGLFGLPNGFGLTDGLIRTKTTSYALFGQATWHVTDRFSLAAGARYSRDEVERTEDRISFGSTLPTATGRKTFDDVSPRLSAVFELNDDSTLYATVSKGYKAGGLQTNVESASFPVTPFDEETLWNYEAGIKSELMEDRVRINMSLFYMDWSDLQVRSNLTETDPDTGLPIFLLRTTNAASAVSKGAEFEFRALLSSGFEIGGGVGYLDATFGSFTDAVSFGQSYDLSGERLPRAPKWTANADAQYTFRLGSGLEGFVRGEASYRSGTITIFDGIVREGFPWRAPSFDVWNLRAGVTGDRFRVTAYVENIFDEQYFTGIDPTFGFSGIQLRPSRRTYGLRLMVHTP
jgi:iron complex outermembrane receptor protein